MREKDERKMIWQISGHADCSGYVSIGLVCGIIGAPYVTHLLRWA